MRMFLIFMCGSGLLLAALAGCEDEKLTAEGYVEISEALPSNLIATTQPAGAVDLVEAKKSADGSNVVVKAKIGGTKDPLSVNRAVMTVIDLTLPTCDSMTGETCPTPWDACCEPTEQIAAKSATVQVVGADGKPLKANLGSLNGVSPGKKIIVTGTTKKPAGSEALIIDATQIYVIP